ncbi:MAG: MBL fold metallo-hydrolase [Thermoanaerobacteraceae bacterium]|uniref:MBL fold metallo-hydrolase n=1 Tax=Thermanaeromonas sp. C210 TaxID=2731925 RepID=UPI00155BB775|nr:MBL fold metallo-hydrolase [Thermanaeromonas sp. C210]MBE3581075.1 MBL fold metallo-hydrolase [Thermoanaerobacteraceae bacterium]GFN22663.1 putative metallo-hydrolase YhfI [Thermanaeromonas sp. C210]
MRLTILGCYTPYPPPGGACLGYLLEGEGTRLVLEFGSGIMARLQEYVPFWEVDGIFLSHLHGDHMSDLWVYRYAVDQAVAEGKRKQPVPVWAPSHPEDVFRTLTYKEALEAEPLEPGREVTVGDFSLRFMPTRHALPSLAMRISRGAKTLVYTGDAEYSEELASFAQGADLLLAEATYLRSDLEAGATGHMSAGQAAHLARLAGVKRLVLTHLRSWYRPQELLAEARTVFPASQIAVERSVLEI